MKSKKEILNGKWWKINKNIKETIPAKYDKIKNWVMDPKGYFLIKIDKENNLIRVGYCIFKKSGNNPIHEMISEINGISALEIVNTQIDKNYISTLQHAADMGIELNKAELALKYNLNYMLEEYNLSKQEAELVVRSGIFWYIYRCLRFVLADVKTAYKIWSF